MEIRLRPGLEALIRQDVERAPHGTVNEFVVQAVPTLPEQEAWLASHPGKFRLRSGKATPPPHAES
jgi:hypothetical protein